MEREERQAETEGGKLKICILQVAVAAQLHVIYDVLRMSHCLAPTHTAHTDWAPDHVA